MWHRLTVATVFELIGIPETFGILLISITAKLRQYRHLELSGEHHRRFLQSVKAALHLHPVVTDSDSGR
jgi:hypothetical protein